MVGLDKDGIKVIILRVNFQIYHAQLKGFDRCDSLIDKSRCEVVIFIVLFALWYSVLGRLLPLFLENAFKIFTLSFHSRPSVLCSYQERVSYIHNPLYAVQRKINTGQFYFSFWDKIASLLCTMVLLSVCAISTIINMPSSSATHGSISGGL